MTSLASFSAPYLFGGGFRVMTTQITATKLNGDDRLAMVETAALLLLAISGLLLLRRTEGTADAVGARKGVGPAPALTVGPLARAGVAGLGWVLALALSLPRHAAAGVVRAPGHLEVESLPPVYSLANYRAMVADPARLCAAGHQFSGGRRRDRRRAGAGDRRGGAQQAGGVRTGPMLESLLALPLGRTGNGLRHRAGHHLQRARDHGFGR